MKYLLFLIVISTAVGCQTKQAEAMDSQAVPTRVELVTTKGIIQLELSNKTPLHRDNFINIVNEGLLDSMLFHRVLEGFVVQAGEYDSLKISRTDSVELERLKYTVPAEFDSALFHKRGALGAARTDNAERASDALSFYIVQRGMRNDSLIAVDEKRINGWLQKHYFIHADENKIWKDALLSAEENEDEDLMEALQDTIGSLAKSFEFEPYAIPQHHREVYHTLGGTPHLDQSYTVFGEVISGMPVVDSIAFVNVNDEGRPFEHVYILSAKVLE
jgi:peptidyl-prolyl cis-trans isomerase B (cyclophilin B)